MSELVTKSPIDVDAVVNELAAALKTEAGQLTLTRLPTNDEREAMQARLIVIQQKLRSISYSVGETKPAQLAGAAIFEMLHSFEAWKKKNISKEVELEKQETIGWYVHELRDMPLFAIEAACQDVRQARVPDLNPDWPPSSARMVALARAHFEAGKKKHALVKALIGVSRVRGPEIDERAKDDRVAEGLRTLADTMKETAAKLERERSDAAAKKTIERNNAEILQEHKANNVKPIMAGGMPVSISLRKKIAEYQEQDANHHRNRTAENSRDQGS